jgi:hypothetical protein
MNLFYRISGLSRLIVLLLGVFFLSVFASPFSSVAFAADIDVKGVVKSNTGEPLIGSTVRVKGLQKGTVTNEKGEFLLQGVNDNATLVISMIGFLTKEVKAARSLSIELLEDAVGLQDVVVTGFQQIDKDRR